MLKIGIAGLGGIGRVHAATYAHLEDCTVGAAAEPSAAGQKTAAEFGITCYANLADMLADSSIDVVDVCTPSFMHKNCVIQALESGRPVICEKPLALNGADAREMYALAEEKGLQLMVGHVLQFSPVSRLLHTLVESGEYGRALDAVFLRLSACPQWGRDGWLFDKAKSGLLPFDLHIHDLDLLISLFGIPEKYDVVSGGREGLGYKEYYRFLYHYSNLNVCCEAAWYNADIPFTATWRVYFEKAVALYDGVNATAYAFDQAPRQFDVEEKIKIPTGINIPPTGMFYEELGFFLNRIRQGRGPQYRKDQIIGLIDILENIT
ncbi:MAG: Gfo/Idh/MocA family oxidoreductase [Treponema sp.]|jgi:predicted dehydrogenase|nr:Gfo/Idh/MocA family oxidoreductase [Treponema sp.]